MRVIAPLTIGCFLAAGLAFADDASKPAGLPRSKAPAGATVAFVELADGATVSQDVLIKFAATGIAVAPADKPVPNSGHHHLLIDQQELPPQDLPIPNDATHKHYGKGQTEDTVHLAPGDHTLQLDFADALHMQFDPPIVSRKITVHVK